MLGVSKPFTVVFCCGGGDDDDCPSIASFILTHEQQSFIHTRTYYSDTAYLITIVVRVSFLLLLPSSPLDALH